MAAKGKLSLKQHSLPRSHATIGLKRAWEPTCSSQPSAWGPRGCGTPHNAGFTQKGKSGAGVSEKQHPLRRPLSQAQ